MFFRKQRERKFKGKKVWSYSGRIVTILLNPILKWILNTNFSSFLSDPVTQSPSDVVDFTDVTLACEGSCVAAEYFMERLSLLLMPEQNRSHVVDAGKKTWF